MFKILVAEDEPHLRNIITKCLRGEGYTVFDCYDGENALETFYKEHVDIVITDIMMPRMDGIQLTAQIRKVNKHIPVLMLTALESIGDKRNGFDSGTDDYLVKPILMEELCMRVKALLRRYKINCDNKITLSNAILDFNAQLLQINGKAIELTKKEFQLLFKLLANPGVIFSREQLLNEIWGYTTDSTDRTVDTHISSLRAKTVCSDFEIVTVWGLGYKAVLNEQTR